LAQLLAENEERTLTAAQVEYARTIYSSGNDLLLLISQILDLSKIEAGKLQVEREAIALADVHDYVLGTFRQLAEQKNLRFRAQVAADLPPLIRTDGQRLQQVLRNLLSNALKFTEHGEVSLEIRRESRDPGWKSEALKRTPEVIAFAVRDSGIGIPLEKQQLIFEAFQQADASTSRMYGGTGLGLTISRELAHLLGGEITVQSAPSEGSVFTLYLPLERPASLSDVQRSSSIEAVLSSAEGAEPQALAGRQVLLIDDDARNLFAVTSLLERSRMSVHAASSAQEGLELLERHPDVDIVLMDIMLPGTDGYQATRQIRAVPGMAELPIIALTAKAMPGDREKCLEAGCSGFVPKPVDSGRLMSVIKQALRGARSAP
jgi:CheY-like chemotaxis protein